MNNPDNFEIGQKIEGKELYDLDILGEPLQKILREANYQATGTSYIVSEIDHESGSITLKAVN